nr:immunoglobulin heavy chain junction region [Macaca mulatta]
CVTCSGGFCLYNSMDVW